LPNSSNAVIVIVAGRLRNSTQAGTTARDVAGAASPASTTLANGEPDSAVPDTFTCT
jgi:hypothetical protein